MAQSLGFRFLQYLDWLVRAKTYQECLAHIQELVALCQDMGWIINIDNLELKPKQVVDLVGYQYDLEIGRVKPIQQPISISPSTLNPGST